MSANVYRRAVRALELVCAVTVALSCGLVLTTRRLRHGSAPRSGERRLLVFNSSYSLSELQARRAEHWVTHRDLDGYFQHVWSVHPLVGASPVEPRASSFGPPAFTRLAERHTMVEGKIGRHQRLSRFPFLNFALAQAALVLSLERVVREQNVGSIRADPFYGGLLALVLRRLHGSAVELFIVADHDEVYRTVGVMAYPRLFRWPAVERRVLRYTLSRADSVVTASEDHRKFALANGAPPDRLGYSGTWPMIAPVHRQEPESRSMPEDDFWMPDRPVVACVCRLERMKHPEDLILGVAQARRRDARIAGMIIGEGSMREELRQLCIQHGVEGEVVLTGDRDQDWIARALSHCSVIVAPLAGLALVESALSGTPIVAYDHDWQSEVIRDGETGVLVPYRDTGAMATAICALIENPELSKRLAANARAHVLERMDPRQLLADERRLAERLASLSRLGA